MGYLQGHNSYRNPKVFNQPFEEPKKKRSVKFLKPLLIIIFLAAIYFLFFKSSIFQIKTIDIDKTLPSEVSEYMEQYLGDNIFTFHAGKVREDLLSKYPELTDITVLRGLPDSLKIAFKGRDPKIAWQSRAQNYLLDEESVAFKEVQDVGSLLVVRDNSNLAVTLQQPVASTSFVSFVTGLSSKLENASFKVDHMEVNETTFQIDAILDTTLKLKFDITRSQDDQVSQLVTFWKDHSSEPKNYVDLRVEGKVFYK